jgi:hypothetical protein
MIHTNLLKNYCFIKRCQVYLNYYKDNEMSEGDNPPIGLILCGDKSEALAKYATSGMDNQLFVSKFLVNLPDRKVLEEFIRRELE